MDQNDRHDWFGDLAEDYVAYLAAREPALEVFGPGKWTADVAVHDRRTRRFFRIEVRATDHPSKRPSPKKTSKLAKIAEILAEVTMPETSRLQVSFWKLDSRGHKLPQSRLTDPNVGQLRPWLLKAPTDSSHAPAPSQSSDEDPLLALSGSIPSESTDIADRHDDYIGLSLHDSAGEDD